MKKFRTRGFQRLEEAINTPLNHVDKKDGLIEIRYPVSELMCSVFRETRASAAERACPHVAVGVPESAYYHGIIRL